MYFGIALELLVELVDIVWLGPIGGVLRSKVTDLAALNANMLRHNQTSTTLAEDLIMIMRHSDGL